MDSRNNHGERRRYGELNTSLSHNKKNRGRNNCDIRNNSGGRKNNESFHSSRGGSSHNRCTQSVGRSQNYYKGQTQGCRRSGRPYSDRSDGPKNFKKFRETLAAGVNAHDREGNIIQNNNHNEAISGSTAEQSGTNIELRTGPVHTIIKSPNSPQPAKIMASELKNIKTEKDKSRENSVDSSASSSNSKSEDTAIQSLKKAVENTLQPSKDSAPETQIPEKSVANIKKEPLPKTSSSSSSSHKSSGNTFLLGEEIVKEKQLSEEDVIYLGNVEKIENLVEDGGSSEAVTKCLLCEKPGHTSFQCQMICKNCHGKYHGLKDCPKQANLSMVFSSFMQFCLKQSHKYDPNMMFTIDGSQSVVAPAISHTPQSTTSILSDSITNEAVKRNKSRSGTPKSARKQVSTSESSEIDSDSISYRRKRKRNKNFSAQPLATPVAYPAAFNPSFAFNPLLAFSHMMGYNPAIGFPRHGMKD